MRRAAGQGRGRSQPAPAGQGEGRTRRPAGTPMRRITLPGNAGSGKSTPARQLAAGHGLAVLDPDTIAWQTGAEASPRPAADSLADLRAFCCAHAGRVVEGCYAALIGAIPRCRPTLLFLDPGADACIDNCRSRPWEPHKYASAAEQDARLPAMPDWVRGYSRRDGDLSLNAHAALFARCEGPKRKLTARLGPRLTLADM